MSIDTAQYQQKAYELAGRFRDIRFTGQVVFAGMVLLISWSGVKSIETNYQLQKQIAALKQQNSLQSLKNQNTALQNQYYKTDTYQELSARRNFGLGKPGEKELLVPQSVALANAPAVPASVEPKTSTKTTHTSNFQAWVNFFLNRPSH